MNPYEELSKRANKIIKRCELIQAENRRLNLGEDEQVDRIANLAGAFRFYEAEELMKEYDLKKKGKGLSFRRRFILCQLAEIERKIKALKGR